MSVFRVADHQCLSDVGFHWPDRPLLGPRSWHNQQQQQNKEDGMLTDHQSLLVCFKFFRLFTSTCFKMQRMKMCAVLVLYLKVRLFIGRLLKNDR